MGNAKEGEVVTWVKRHNNQRTHSLHCHGCAQTITGTPGYICLPMVYALSNIQPRIQPQQAATEQTLFATCDLTQPPCPFTELPNRLSWWCSKALIDNGPLGRLQIARKATNLGFTVGVLVDPWNVNCALITVLVGARTRTKDNIRLNMFRRGRNSPITTSYSASGRSSCKMSCWQTRTSLIVPGRREAGGEIQRVRMLDLWSSFITCLA